MDRFANAASIAGPLPRVPIQKLLLRLATIAKALKPAQVAPSLPATSKCVELEMTGLAVIQGEFVRS
jgi:hypothetical protein